MLNIPQNRLMTIKEELEILRGEPIQVFEGDPMEIPCIETSDAEKLCKNPVVSVHMITYNHEPYIREAIEGVMMQQTDFEFELIIGEDCSQDKTREICFEYQKKYPDKIRVLWWHENVSKLGGNSRRVTARCRGEFIAYCEGDDYWIDPLKLQKQVDVMRQHLDVGICFSGVDVLHHETNQLQRFVASKFFQGKILKEDFIKSRLSGSAPFRQSFIKCPLNAQQTSGVLIRRRPYEALRLKYEIGQWRLSLDDFKLQMLIASEWNVYFIPEATSVYRKNGGGATSRNLMTLMRDDCLIRIYFTVHLLGMTLNDAIRFQGKSVVRMLAWRASNLDKGEQYSLLASIFTHVPSISQLFNDIYALPILLLIRFGLLKPKMVLFLSRVYWHLPRLRTFK